MNRRLNSVLFILAATVFNILVMFAVFALALITFARFLAPSLPPGANQIILIALFIASIVLTYLIYHRLVRWLTRKYDFEQWFGPLFGRRDGQ